MSSKTNMKVKRRSPNMDGTLLDLSNKGLIRLEIPAGENPTALIADRNSISRIENIEHCQNVRQLSLKSNRLLHMGGVGKLRHLSVLNLPQNSIAAIDGLRELIQLVWLNLSGNSIKVMDNLINNLNLKHLDLSDNNISSLGDIHHLQNLKTLLLHGNIITSLRTAPHFLPKSVTIFSLAENELADINEVSFLSCLPELQQLSIMNNPCVTLTASILAFDYRPFVVNWCPILDILDGYPVTEKENLKAEWLYSQGKGHHFKIGQHLEAIQYLATVCPLQAPEQLESAEDAKLSQILNKQRYHQQQLQQRQQQQPQWNIPAKSPPHGDNSNITETGSPSQPIHSRPVKAWSIHADSTSSSIQGQAQDRSGQHLNDLSVQDVTSEDYEKRSTSSLLDSESTYLPVDTTPQTPARPRTAPTEAMLSAPVTQHVLDLLTRGGENRPATAIGDNKYDAYDRRPVKPLNQELVKGYYKPDFNISQPQISGNEPVVGTKKKVPPTAQPLDCDTSQEVSQIDDIPKENAENIPVRDLSIIKAAAQKARKVATTTKKEDSKSVKDKKKDTKDSVFAHSGNRTSIPVSNRSAVTRTQSEYVPGKYSASRRPGTADSDLSRTKGKTIKTIPEKVINTDRLARNDIRRDHSTSLHDSGIFSRPTSDAVLAEEVRFTHPPTKLQQLAATKIQSYWRGFYTREHHLDAVRVRREIRARRAEEHIVVLRTELDRQRELYHKEKQLRTLQLEAIRQLWKEVQSLQTWKNSVLQSQSFVTQEVKREHEYNSYNSSLEIQNTLARAEMLNKMGESITSQGMSTQSTMDTNKQLVLEKTCAKLQSQVSELQEALKSVSSLVQQSTGTGSLPITPRTGTNSLNTSGNANKGAVPHSLSPYPSEEEEAYFRMVPQPGCPTPPRSLRLENRGLSALVLRWQASKVLDGEGKEMNKPIIGYRVFVNDKAKAMIAGTKQKALIEGLDPSLTYKIYVKAVSELGESNTSDVVMAALGKGTRRRSSSSDSNRSYDSDRESTSSERRSSHRKDSRKKGKNKSPRSSKHDRHEKGGSGSKDGDVERVPSKMELEAEGIITQARIYTNKHNRSRDYNKTPMPSEENLKPKETPQSPVMRGPKVLAQESQGFSYDVRSKSQQVADSQQSMSSTFTVDSQNSVLVALSMEAREDHKEHRRRRSKDLKNERGDLSDSSISSAIVTRTVDSDRNVSGTESPSVRRNRSKESKDNSREDSDSSIVRGEGKRNSAKISPTAGSQGVPVIDGRKRHSSGSRPSSPACSDMGDGKSSINADKRRMPMADLLEQRFSGRVSQSTGSTASSTATVTHSQVENSVSDLPPPIPKREGKYSSLENLSNRSPTERYSPTNSDRRRSRNNSTCSESDIPSNSQAARQLDMDKNTNAAGNTGIVAKLLHKLQNFSKTQEESLRTTKMKRKSEGDEPQRKTSGDSESGDIPSGHTHSDSSGVHSDDSQQVTQPSYRTHRRTTSDQRGVPIKLDQQPSSSSSHRPDHSPVIRDSSKTPTVASGTVSTNNIKRHASFHGILPSKKEEIIRSGSTENLSDKSAAVKQHQQQHQQQQSIDITVPTTPTRRHRPRSRSRSPGHASHVPIISAAQLQRTNKVPSSAT